MSEPWYRRFMQALPPIPDSAMVLGFLVLVLALGVVIGQVLCAQRAVDQAVERAQQRPLLERIEALEQRVKALEGR